MMIGRRMLLAVLCAGAVLPPSLAEVHAASRGKRAAVKPVQPPALVVPRAPPGASHAVHALDGHYLGADPDPRIRFQLLRDGKLWEQTGP
jgi:hypothetical protein